MKTTGIEIIAAERKRHTEVEGWTSEHDDVHTDNSIAKAAACYAMPTDEREKYQSFTFSEPKRFYPRWWPASWDVSWWKPTPGNRIKELAKAGALIVAEIDRLLRKEGKYRELDEKGQMPSDEEIQIQSINQGSLDDNGCQAISQLYFRKGAKWVRDNYK